MFKLHEGLLPNDLKMLVKNIIDIDSYKSKMDDDKNMSVIAFTVKTEEAAKDLLKFLERGYDFVMDADFSADQIGDDYYKVFVEIKRTKKLSDQILEMLDGVKKITDISNFRFRYYKNFRSHDVTIENLNKFVPLTKADYSVFIGENYMGNYDNFFGKSYLKNIRLDEDKIIFEKIYADTLIMKIKQFGKKDEVYSSIEGRYMLENSDIAEVLFLTKYLGNYNINKIGNTYVLENEHYALALEKLWCGF